MLEEVALGHVLFWVIRFCPLSIFPRLLYNLIYSNTTVTRSTWEWRIWVFQIKKNIFHILEGNGQKRVLCCHFEIKRFKDDGKLKGQLNLVLDLNIPNTEQNQISLDFSILMLTFIFFRRIFTFSWNFYYFGAVKQTL